VAEVLIEGRRLDVMEGLDFSFNYSIADVRDPNKRSTNYSKTIKCPSTKNNDLLFGHIYDVNISNPNNPSDVNVEVNFNPNKKAEARVIQDGVEVMTGVVQLRSITINNGRYDYEVVFIGNLKTIFSELGDKKLNETDENGDYYIDFSDLDHAYNATNIENSWSNSTGYVYPMIDYGIRFEYENNGDRIYDLETWRPAVFLKDIFDRIFAFTGFSYDSDFLNSSPFNKLIVPFHAEDFTMTDDQIEARQFIAEVDTEQEVLANTTLETIGGVQYEVLRLDYADQSDPNNLWDASTNEFSPNALGYYEFTVNSSFVMTRYANDPLSLGGVVPAYITVYRESNSVVSVIDAVAIDIDIPDNPNVGQSATTNVTWSTQQELLYIGDTVWVEIQIRAVDYNTIGQDNYYTITHQLESTFSNNVAEQAIFEGSTVYMNNFAPDVKMSDILLGVFKMFNLYVTIDPVNETNLIIETRDEYYAGGTIRDWTKKLARDEKIELKPLGLLSAKEYLYEYDSDDDYYNKRYEDRRGEVYGTRRVEIDNDFLNNNNKVSIAFSATPLVNDGNTNRIIPAIYDEDIDEGGKPVDINMRVLYYQGLRPCAPYWTFRYNAENTSVQKTRYPYAGHLNDPLTPTLDLNFGIPQELYYTSNGWTGALQYTNANLFNVYHRAHILEITDKDAKVLRGSFYLDAWDIEKLDFRDQILIDNCYWRINKINDYNPFKEGLTKVELFKVLDIVEQPFESFTLGNSGSTGSGIEQEDMPYNWGKSRSNFNLFPIGRGTVNGYKNKVGLSANNFKIIGDNNYISEGSNKVSITGNGNQVLNGASNIVLINTDNTTVTESNTIYQNGVNVTGGEVQSASLVIASADVLQLNSTPQTIVPAQGVGKAIEVISASVKVDFNTTPYATNVALTLITNGANQEQAIGIINASASSTGRFRVTPNNGTTSTQVIENAALQVSVTTGNPTAGDSDIEVFVLYRVINV
jgi:hypothetical protein